MASGGGRKAQLPDMEEVLVCWIDEMQSNNLRVTWSSIQRKALELRQGEEEQPDFNASRGWLEKFMCRHGLSLRRKTSVSQKLPGDLIPKVMCMGFIYAIHPICAVFYAFPYNLQFVSFITTTRKLRIRNDYPLALIGNMDETPLWLDMPGETTVARTGERTVCIRTTGHDKGCFTVVLAAMADGRKLNPFVVFKDVQPNAPLAKIPGVVVAYSSNGWMNEALTLDWIHRVWGVLNFNKCLLVWDA